jgi:uncharacterized protein with GYD domain
LFFITLIKLVHKPTKENVTAMDKWTKGTKHKSKILSIHWTLGRYDVVIYSEAPDEKTALATAFAIFGGAQSETMVAIPREEALKAVGLR